MEFGELSKKLEDRDFKFQSLDYLYLHCNDSYPLQKEMDFDNLYFVIESKGLIVKVIGVLSGFEKELNFADKNDNWWFLRLPEQILNKLYSKK
ncbi:hypothetical protein [Maribellus maritimus]|uniref:hypothetical protein n=1 Tax=Maribellus maritimus TaxID=2870838 RepID=UPI001EEA21A6|nr:hypothetical protein [Maribellus maritimus]MCG6191374.1 hypothetical protein [Maribellus maritimus]